MTHTALTPVFVGLRTGLHVLVAALVALVIGRAIIAAEPLSVVVIGLSVLFLITYTLGGLISRPGVPHSRLPGYLWLAALTAEWVLLVWLTAEAAYLVFPLFFLFLHVLPRWSGTIAVFVATGIAIVALGVRSGWTVGGIVGPLIGAGIAIMIGLGYQSLAREATERERLMAELMATRGQLAATEHEAGVLAERARIARELHDTVAQHLSSIQMLLHAAERADPDTAGIEHIRLARGTAATSLADARRFIKELAPAELTDQGIGAALRRLADTQWQSSSLAVQVRVADSLDLSMNIQTALLRIAQGAMANVVQHADARTAVVTIERDAGSVLLTIADDGRGFDADAVTARTLSGRSDSFGLTATRERVDQLGGTLTIATAPGHGTSITVELSTMELSTAEPSTAELRAEASA